MRALAVLLCVALPATAGAQEIGIGLFAPSAPFDGPVARLDFVSAFAKHVGPRHAGRAYGRATDFIAAARRGDIRYAIVDAPFLAGLGMPYTVLASFERGGGTHVAWEVITASKATSVLDLKGKVVAVPAVGAREAAFLHEVLLEGELPADFFGKVIYAPDALSAVAAVAHGRAEAAFVPGGLPLPPGVRRIATLAPIGWPVLVALPGAEGTAEVAAAAVGFSGPGSFTVRKGGGEAVREIADRFGRGTRRPPMVVSPLSLTASGLLSGRTFSVSRPDVTTYITYPVPRSGPK